MSQNKKEQTSSVIERTRSSHLSKAIANILDPNRTKTQLTEGEKISDSFSVPTSDLTVDSHKVPSPVEQKIVPFPQLTPKTNPLVDYVSLVAIDNIEPSPHQTRQEFPEEEIQKLAVSIAAKGVLQPILIRPKENGKFELIAGERRLRAAKLAGCIEIPAQVLDCSEQESAELALVENLQRENLNPIEEARAYKALTDSFGLTQKDIAELVGRSRAVITNSIRLLHLHPEIISFIENGDLSAGHGKVLLTIEDQNIQLRLAHRVISAQLSVRNLELIVEAAQKETAEPSEDDLKLRNYLDRLESKLKEVLELEHARISVDNQGRKRLQLIFDSDAALRRFISKLK